MQEKNLLAMVSLFDISSLFTLNVMLVSLISVWWEIYFSVLQIKVALLIFSSSTFLL